MPDSCCSLFAYGSLQLPEIFEAVTHQSGKGIPAILRGYRCSKLKGFGFSAIFPALGEETPGVLYRSLDPDAWRRLDAFEDDFYDRQLVRIRLGDGSICKAYTYVLSNQCLHLYLNEPWSLDDLDCGTVQDLLERI